MTFLAAFTCLCGAARTSADGEPPYANELRDARAQLDAIRQRVAVMDGEYGKYGEYTAADVAQMRKDYEPTYAAWEKAIAAYEGGQLEPARALRTAAWNTNPPVNWLERLARRERQAQVAPSERFVLGEIGQWSSGAARPLGQAWVEAKKKCSEAWGRLADAMTPEADPQKRIELQDQAYAADIMEETAGLRYQWANNVERGILYDKRVTSPELTRVLGELRETGERRIALRVEEIDRLRRGRELERRQRALEQQAHKAFDAAYAAREQSLRKAREDAERKAREAREEAQRRAQEEAERKRQK